MSNTLGALIAAVARDSAAKSQVWRRLFAQSGSFQMRARTTFPSAGLVHPSSLRIKGKRTSVVVRLQKQPILRLTLQSRTIDAVTYPRSHTADYSKPPFTVVRVEEEEEWREGRWRAGGQMSWIPRWASPAARCWWLLREITASLTVAMDVL